MKKNIAWGLVFIVLGVYLVVSRLGYAPDLPFFKILFTALFAYGTIRGFMKQNFFEAMISLAFIGCIYNVELGITALTPWVLLCCGALIGVGLDLVFKNRKKKSIEHININSESRERVSNENDSDYVSCENNLGSMSKYVNTDHFIGADLENNLGSMNVYFDNAIMGQGSARVCAETNFGEMNLYFPKTWRVECHEDTAFGSINFKGQGSTDHMSPTVILDAEANFGAINIFFS